MDQIISHNENIEESTPVAPKVTKVDFKEIEKIHKQDEIVDWINLKQNDTFLKIREQKYFAEHPEEKIIFVPSWVVRALKNNEVDKEYVKSKYNVTDLEIDELIKKEDNK